MENYSRIIDRLFEEVDRNNDRISKLAEIVHKQSGYLKVWGRITMLIALFLLTTALTVLYDKMKTPVPVQKMQVTAPHTGTSNFSGSTTHTHPVPAAKQVTQTTGVKSR